METRIELFERRLEKTECELQKTQRRLRSTRIMAFGGVVGALVLALHPEAQAQFAITLTSLQNQINTLTPRVTALESRATAVENRATAVEDKTQFVSVSGGDMFIIGTNVFIQNGLGATNGIAENPLNTTAFQVNGKGNLIVGYNALRGGAMDDRTGSHNLIVGDFHNYTRFGGIVGGIFNTISGNYASVTGGVFNTVSGNEASISGGFLNTASGLRSSISGGRNITQSAGIAGWSAGGNGGQGDFHSP
jgi:hypothetical protein